MPAGQLNDVGGQPLFSLAPSEAPLGTDAAKHPADPALRQFQLASNWSMQARRRAGLSSFPCRLGEDHLIQRQIRDRAPKTGVLGSKTGGWGFESLHSCQFDQHLTQPS